MAVKAPKKKVGEHEPHVKILSVTDEVIDLKDIDSNEAQPRGSGVLPRLADQGYGLFEHKETSKKPVWTSLLSDDPDDRALMIGLIEQYEGDFVGFAKSIEQHGLLEPIGVWWPAKDGADIIFGARRATALAFNWAKNEDSPRAVTARVFEFDGQPSAFQLRLLAEQENTHRKDASVVDQAYSIKELQKAGYSVEQIAQYLGKSQQYVADRLTILRPECKHLLPRLHVGAGNMDGAIIGLGLDPVIRAWRRWKDAGGKGDLMPQNRGGSKSANRYRLPGAKTLGRWMATPLERKPKGATDELWKWFREPLIRQFFVEQLGLDASLVDVPEPPAEEAAAEPEAARDSNGEAPAAAGKKPLGVPRTMAKDLLVSLGLTQARTFKDATLAEKLENIVNLPGVDENTEPETKVLKALYKRLNEAYANGQKVVIKDDK